MEAKRCSREQLERRDMPRLDGGEMAEIERRNPGLTLPLCQRDHRGVDEAKRPVSILGAQLAHPCVVIHRQVQDGERAVLDPAQHFVKRAMAAGQLREEVVQLDQDRSGQQQLTSGSQQFGAARVVSVARRHRRIEHTGVDDHRWP
jgi:hypothetical protein